MSLGAALLQPQTLQRSSFDDVLALGEDVARVAAIILEDAAAAGPMAGAVERSIVAVGEGLAASFEPRLRAVEASLRGRIAGPVAEIESLAQDIEGLAQDPAAIVGIIRQLLGRLKALADSATLPVIRAELQFWKSLVEDDFGLSPEFLTGVIASFITTLRAELAAITSADLAAVRRLRLCESLLVRLGLRAQQLRPPDIDIEPLAREIEAFLRNSGITGALREFSCALDGVEAALEAVVAAGGAVRQVLQPVGAGVVPLQDATDYSWYASWLLNDEDVPLLGLSDISDPKGFLLQLKGTGEFERRLRVDHLQEAVRTAVNDYMGPAEPPKELMLTVLAGINVAMQTGPILRESFDDSVFSDSDLGEEIVELRRNYEADQSLFLYNRRLMEKVFHGKVDTYSTGFLPDLGTLFLNTIGWPRNQVFVTGDRRYVMCDDKPIHYGENVKWYEAPLFSKSERGQMWFDFRHISPQVCEGFALVLAILAEAGKSIWHLVDLQPSHEAQAATVGTIEIADTIQQILFGKPVSAYFLEGGPHFRRWGKSLDSLLGLKGIATMASTLQSMHSDAPGGNIARFWLTVALGDIFRTISPISTLNAVRDLFLGTITLINFRGPQDGPSQLPDNPSRNHMKQGAWVALSDTLFAMLLISLYPRDNYSIFIWSKDLGTQSDRRRDMFLGHWLGGSAGLGLVAGLTGSFVAQVIAWGEDYPRFFKTGAKSALKMFLLYWVYNYLFRENTTDGGRYRAGGGSFRGYPERDVMVGNDRRISPYRLPAPAGTTLYTGQGNLGLFSHNFISNTDFVTPGDSATQQVYSFDFGYDFRREVACVRDGVIVSFVEGMVDSSEGDENQLIIRHTTIDDIHDRFEGATAVQTYSVYLHLAENGVTDAPAFSTVAPAPGRVVLQGELIALAGDTGNSFHNHMHIHIVPDDGSGQPDLTFAIPFVFFDVAGDGVPKSRTWYRAGSEE